MSLNKSMLNASNCSTFVDSAVEESTINSNVQFSKLDLSDIVNIDATIQSTKYLTQKETTTPNLSITLEQKERDILKKNRENGQANNSIMDISILDNGTSENSMQVQKSYSTNNTSTLKDLNSTTIEEVSMVTEIADDDDDDEKKRNQKTVDESVIPVDEEDDDDEVEEVTCIEDDDRKHFTLQKEMFSHLQIPKPSEESNEVQQELTQDQEVTDIYTEQVEDESKLFQYPLIELGRRLWSSTADKQHYTKGCLWSPDGTCLLAPVHLDGMHVVELPIDLYTVNEINIERNLSDLASAVHVKEGGTVYDYCWYPYMNSSEPGTCCWLATRQHEPIHMWDAFTGELRCSYRGYDDVDEVESAITIIFSNNGEKVIGGYKKTIKIFDTNIPGRDYNSIPVKNAVSCFALTTENDNCVTAGTWAGYIHHYDLRAPKLGPLFTLGGHDGGITWLKYTATQDNNWYLFSGARRDKKILQWDMRNYTEPLQVFERNVDTNQRIYYDLSPLNTWLASGDTQGLLRVWNLGNRSDHFELPLHQDCCNGVSFHPTLPIISTTSGQYHFADNTDTDETTEKIIDYENSLLFLWYGPSDTSGMEVSEHNS